MTESTKELLITNKIIFLTVKEYSLKTMIQDTKEIGKWATLMEPAPPLIQEELSTEENTIWVKEKETDTIDVLTMNMKEDGIREKWMAMEDLLGMMEDNMKENLATTNSTELDLIDTKMASCIEELLKTERNMEKEPLKFQRKEPMKAFGMRTSRLEERSSKAKQERLQ